jgi:hypothetical protein
VTDYGKLIKEARRAETAVYLAAPDSVAADLARIIRGLADALDFASAQLDSMTEEWGVRVSVPSQWWIETMRTREECERWIANPPLRYTHQVGEAFSIVKRLAAGPWVEVEGDKSNE